MNIIKSACDKIVNTSTDMILVGKSNHICKECGYQDKDEDGENRLSKEGLCFNCEVINYPERFYGCVFCKRPIRGRLCCDTCEDGFVTWIKDNIHPVDVTSRMIRNSARSLVRKDPDEGNKHKFIMRTEDSMFKWPGFYAGVTNRFVFGIKSANSDDREDNYMPIWIIPNIHKEYKLNIRKHDLNPSFFESVLLDILKTNFIDLYQDTQIDLSQYSRNNIKEVNRYDTRIVKNIF